MKRFLQPSGKDFLAQLSSCILIFYLSTGTLREGKIFWKSFSLVSILGHCAKNIGLLAFYSCNLSKLLSKFPKVKTEENSPSEFSVSSIFFGHWAEDCQKLSRSFRQHFQNCMQSFQKCPLRKLYFIQTTWYFSKILWSSAKKKIWRIVCCENCFFSLLVIEWKFVGFCRKVFGRVVKTAFQVSTKDIWWFCFLIKPFFSKLISNNEWKIAAFCQKFFDRYVKTAF